MRHLTGKPDKSANARLRRFLTTALAGILALASPARAADLKPQTQAAFDRYTQLTQAQFKSELARHEPFLWVEGLPDDRRATALSELHAGDVVIEGLETFDAGKSIAVPDGMIHHWIGTVFIPGATLAQTLTFLQDYDRQQDYFRPDVQRSKLLRHNGDDFTIELRLYKKKIITTVLDTVHEVHYSVVDATHAWSVSRSSRIQEVDDPGQPGEHLEPEGHDNGFLWRMNNYWRFEEKDGGTYVECQSVSLTRDIPTGLGWMIGAYVSSVPRESLTFTLATTRAAILERAADSRSARVMPKAK